VQRERAAGGPDADVGDAVGRERDLQADGAEAEEHGGTLEVEPGEAGLLGGPEGVVPDEGEGVDVGAVGRDEGERAEVGLQRGAALLEGGGVQEGGGLDRRGAEVAGCVEVVGVVWIEIWRGVARREREEGRWRRRWGEGQG
jgi:hypothetical protein